MNGEDFTTHIAEQLSKEKIPPHDGVIINAIRKMSEADLIKLVKSSHSSQGGLGE